MVELRELLKSETTFSCDLSLGKDGTLIDHDGVEVCKFNLKDLSLSQAFTYATLLQVAARYAEQLASIEQSELKGYPSYE